MSYKENTSTNYNSDIVDEEVASEKQKYATKKILLKLYFYLSIPVFFLLCFYFIWLFASKVDITFKQGNSEATVDTEAKIWAENKINELLTNNFYGCISAHKDLSEGLIIEVTGNEWKSLSDIKKRAFIRNIARARRILEVPNNVTVVDNISQAIYATYSPSQGLRISK